MPEDKAFIDTNIIIYAYDVTAGKKHETARIIITDLWDSMIIEAAIKGGATVLMSEDLQDGQAVSGVTIKNPF